MGLFGKSKTEKELEKKVAELEQKIINEKRDIIKFRSQKEIIT